MASLLGRVLDVSRSERSLSNEAKGLIHQARKKLKLGTLACLGFLYLYYLLYRWECISIYSASGMVVQRVGHLIKKGSIGLVGHRGEGEIERHRCPSPRPTSIDQSDGFPSRPD